MNEVKKLQLIQVATDLIADDGSVSGWEHIERFERAQYVLAHYWTGPGCDSPDERRSVVFGALRRLKHYPEVTLHNYNLCVAEEFNSLKGSHPSEFLVGLSMNLRREQTEYLRGRTVATVHFDPQSYADFTAQFDFSSDRLDPWAPDESNSYRDKYTYLTLRQHAHSVGEALQKAYQRYEAARAQLNFSLSAFTWTRGTPDQRSTISPSPAAYCFTITGELLDSIHTVGSYRYSIKNLSDSDMKKSQTILDRFQNASDGALKKRVVSALALYGEALDHVSDSYRFLNLWQCLEILLSGSAPRPEGVSTRLKGLFKDENAFHALVNILVQKRNCLVHQGTFNEIDEDDANNLKHVVDQVIWILLGHCNFLRESNQLDEFWNLIQGGRAALEVRKAIADYLLTPLEKPPKDE